jgi:hypothetical protein
LHVARGWVYWNKRDPGAASHVSMSRADRQRAANLAAREEYAEQAGTRAMAIGNWIAAAELEEVRVNRQDELAQLLLGRRVEPRTRGPAGSKIELDSEDRAHECPSNDEI